jgi:hypothetical protein
MRRFVEGVDRGQTTLFPECLEDWILQENVLTRPRPDSDIDPTCQWLTGCKIVRYLLTDPRQFDILQSGPGWRDYDAIRSLKRRELATPPWVVTASKRCFECDAGS